MTLSMGIGLQALRCPPMAPAAPPVGDTPLLRISRHGDLILDGDLVLKSLKGSRFRLVVSDCGSLSTSPFTLAPAGRLDVKPIT